MWWGLGLGLGIGALVASVAWYRVCWPLFERGPVGSPGHE
jgi:hypothetical protein